MSSLKINRLNEFLEMDDSDSFTRFALALEYLKLGEAEKALSHFNYIVDTDPLYVGVYYHIGKLFEQLDLTNEAVQAYTKGIQIATSQNDLHTSNELQQALDDMTL